eukprot:15162674-Ditylum_brightwellii.AAC.1
MSQTNRPTHTKAAYKAAKPPPPSEDLINIAVSDEFTVSRFSNLGSESDSNSAYMSGKDMHE